MQKEIKFFKQFIVIFQFFMLLCALIEGGNFFQDFYYTLASSLRTVDDSLVAIKGKTLEINATVFLRKQNSVKDANTFKCRKFWRVLNSRVLNLQTTSNKRNFEVILKDAENPSGALGRSIVQIVKDFLILFKLY